MYVKKGSGAKGPGGGAHALVTSGFGERLPALWEYLTLDRWPDGKPRKTATLTLFVEEALVKLCLNDREEGRSGWVSGTTVEAALDSLDAQLREDDVDWRRAKDRGGKGR